MNGSEDELDNIDNLIDLQESNAIKIEALFNNLKKEAVAKRTRGFLRAKLREIQSKFAEFNTQHNKVYELVPKGQRKHIKYFSDKTYDKIDEIQSQMEVKIEEWMDEFDCIPPPAAQITVPENANINFHSRADKLRLERIKIETFSGDCRKWMSFKSLFTTLVHENHDLSAIEKFHHLISNVSGDAKRLISHYNITTENYAVAWQSINDRYDNHRVLVNNELKSLIEQPSISQESVSGIRNLLDMTQECLNSLRNLKIDVSSWDPIIIHILVHKLDAETHRHWENSLEDPKKLPTYQQFIEFLEKRLHILGNITTAKYNPSAVVNTDHRPSECKAKSTNEKPFNRSYNSTYQNKQRSFFASSNFQCPICGDSHNVFNCTKFISANQQNRLAMIEQKNLCINCFGTHPMETCSSPKRCKQCQHRHHTLLHEALQSKTSTNTKTATATATPSQPSSSSSLSTQIDHSLNISSHHADIITHDIQPPALLATAIIGVTARNGVFHKLRCLIDQGSTASFITESVAQALQLQKIPITATINGVGSNTSKSKYMVNVNIMSIHSDYNLIVEAIILSNITDTLPLNAVKPAPNWQHIRGLNLADPQYYRSGKIDMLLGADVYCHILLNGIRKGPPGAPLAQHTHLGWILSGATTEYIQKRIITMHINTSIEIQLKKFWELEDCPETRVMSENDQECERFFNITHQRGEDGRYIVGLPFIVGRQALGQSKLRALNRFHQLEKRFNRNEDFHQRYSKVINEYLQLGHMREANSSQNDLHSSDLDSYFLPHHAVMKESSSTTKLRVVFDASAKTTSGESLNDQLLVGPSLQEDLLAILLRWRTHRFIISADITKMYRQVRMRKSDNKYQKILWRNHPQQDIKEYELQTVTFGTACAAYLAVRSLQQLAIDESHRFPAASSIVINDFYVDDLLTGADSTNTAKQLYMDITALLSSGGFEICQWISNNQDVLDGIPVDKRNAACSIEVDQQDNLQATKTLGLHYHPQIDIFTFKVSLTPADDRVTKRKLLSETARLFDPLGWLSPVIIKAKIMFQQLWQDGYEWDQHLSDELQEQWTTYKRELPKLENLTIHRWLGMTETNASTEIHGFCDASERAYAASIYIRIVNADKTVSTSLIVAKTKVAPLKTISLPRLELCGAELLAKLVTYIYKALRLQDIPIYAWTDSEIVLAWLRGEPSRWKTFVANRVVKIHQHLHPNQWRHISSQHNPADCASRGVLPSVLVSHSLWWSGPEWLRSADDQWKLETNIDFNTSSEMRKSAISHHSSSSISTEPFIEKYSSLGKLLRTVATLFRFNYNCKNAQYKITGPLLAKDINNAENVCIRIEQATAFKSELSQLKKGMPLHCKSKLLNFKPFIDQREEWNNIIRIGGRVHLAASISYDQRHPILLSPRSHFTNLLIRDAHIRTLHGGAQLTLSILRKKYWLINGRNTIKAIIDKCVTCHRYKKTASNQIMGNLHAPRIAITRPFTNVGVDYAGPIDLKTSRLRNAKICKGYIAIFICFSTKAVHIEVVSDLTTPAFLAAFDRFTGRRGLPSDMYSDNGTNFVGADREIQRMIKKAVNLKEIQNYSANKGIQWHFIPPRSPHFGGLWEAAVKSAKRHLRRVVGAVPLTFEEMSTVLIQIEACLNSRPLVAASDDHNDFTAISPGHFLTGSELLAAPSDNFNDCNMHALTKWKLLKKMRNDVWKQWCNDYLASLQQLGKWKQSVNNVKKGAMVIVKEDNLPPTKWSLGRIIETHPGQDGIVRVVTIKTTEGEYKRPITKISPLPITYEADV